MREIAIVKKRSRVWPILIALIVIALVVLAALYVVGDQPVADGFGWYVPEQGRTANGTA